MSNHLHTKNPRGKKLNTIMTKIAMFMVQDAYIEEEDAQKLLTEAIAKIEQAQDILIKNDELAGNGVKS